jgi:hypothetical protein
MHCLINHLNKRTAKCLMSIGDQVEGKINGGHVQNLVIW